MNRQFLDPLCWAGFPRNWPRSSGRIARGYPKRISTFIAGSLDFLGLNYYTRSVNRHDKTAAPVCASPVKQPGARYTELDWEVHPDSLTTFCCRVRKIVRRAAHLHHRKRGRLRRPGARPPRQDT